MAKLKRALLVGGKSRTPLLHLARGIYNIRQKQHSPMAKLKRASLVGGKSPIPLLHLACEAVITHCFCHISPSHTSKTVKITVGIMPSANPIAKKASFTETEGRCLFFDRDGATGSVKYPPNGASAMIRFASATISPSDFFLTHADSDRIKYACSNISLSVFRIHTTLFSQPFIISATVLFLYSKSFTVFYPSYVRYIQPFLSFFRPHSALVVKKQKTQIK